MFGSPRMLISWLALPFGALAAQALLAAPVQAQATAQQTCAGNPNAIGVSRVVEIDTTGGPGFGSEHFNTHDFLRTGEIVLTFDDGPWPVTTAAVLAALEQHCTKAIFFSIGKHATYHPEILKEVVAKGHSVGTHTWSHADLSKLTPETVAHARETLEPRWE